MTSQPSAKPKRTPPPKIDQPGPKTEAPTAGRERLGVLNPATVANDGSALQEHLDRLARYLDQLTAQLRQSQKLAGIGTTAAMFAHEFNNLFAPVLAYAHHALSTRDEPLMVKALEKTVSSCETMRAMTDRLVGLARQGDGAIKSVNVKKLAEDALACLVRNPEKDGISVNLQIDAELAVRTNENQLLQVLFNLLINARHAMRGKAGRLTIDAAATDQRTVHICVRDTGCGIAPENMSKIFEPFFSTKQSEQKPDQRGLGLGLSICRDIIEEMDGKIEVASELSVGTTFTLSLPQAD